MVASLTVTEVDVVRSHYPVPIMRVSYKGITLRCQRKEVGSFPTTRSNNVLVGQLVEPRG
jgi:hypothetical protein